MASSEARSARHTTTVRLPPGLWLEVQRHAVATGSTLNGLVAVALRKYLDESPQPALFASER